MNELTEEKDVMDERDGRVEGRVDGRAGSVGRPSLTRATDGMDELKDDWTYQIDELDK